MSRIRLIACIGVGLALLTLTGWVASQLTDAGHARRLYARSQALLKRGEIATATTLLQQLVERYPATPRTDDAWWTVGQLAMQRQDWPTAQRAFQQVLQTAPMSELVPQAHVALGEVNIRLLFSPHLTPQDQRYVVQPGDTLVGIARRFQTTVELLRPANGLTSHVIQPRMTLKIPGGTFTIIVDKSQNILLLKRGEDILKEYRVATCADNSTPVGTFTIVNRLEDPPWYSEHGVIPAHDPRNILGTRWLGFDKPGYGIHGTTDPASIGSHATAGCVRMRNADVEELYAIIPEGTQVTIIN